MRSSSGSPASDALSRGRGPWLGWTAAAVVAVVLGAGVWWVAGDSGSSGTAGAPERTISQQRALSELSGCLVTEPSGVARQPASHVWAGLQEAAADAKARVSFLPLTSAGAPRDQVNALIAQRCTVVLAVGAGPAGAVRAVAGDKPSGVRFAATGPDGAGKGVRQFEATRAGTRTVTAAMFAEQRGEKS